MMSLILGLELKGGLMDRVDEYSILFFGLVAIALAIWALVDMFILLG